ncbi:uncharacterized protein CcaverHIS019_0203510 [Cutaneotrichosporon cavernicola]|uniref:Tafazzin family protein n=1 Tax=Cutaneotrichosporon cavernicola TaxID=279322 RepID=A0AA48I0J4_9TREE|nr:uncharacterized protein CcaverHIS019_0203510 [Cutaneotrichosporon cavernicola]BEI88989.1 hypothetical protein CcaverHIS019_0203510 [Cutaneotrichosporon cavernicola]BEI96765.1 hypothetical protein CcaverHIS631_0203540 [Cutaneotrichosporon cavernicola]BEJ04537.1 hypothetical protein CcaverHIS641_0203540 [Cutaneotrichosporon cavernicola]
MTKAASARNAASKAASRASRVASSHAISKLATGAIAPRRGPSLASALTLSTVSMACKAFLRATTTVHVAGEESLYSALGIKGRGGAWKRRRGVITIANHNSVVDDPMMWSLLPTTTYFPFAGPRYTCANSRWTLGASDIMFTNPTLSKFFGWGQVIETVRGGGIYQLGVDDAIRKIEEGGWVHMFPEGRVNQAKSNPDGGMYRFKWGVGRIIMDSEVMPEIIPIWISGFDQIMNEHRKWPRFLPRPGANVSITVGESLTPLVAPLVDAWRAGLPRHPASGSEPTAPTRVESDQSALRAHQAEHADYLSGAFDPDESTRREITALLQNGLRSMGEAVESGEGRFAKQEWSQSRRRESQGGLPAPEIEMARR